MKDDPVHLIQRAHEIKVRAERRCGELLAGTAAAGERATRNSGGANIPSVSNRSTPRPPTLADIGLTRDESSRYQQLAAMLVFAGSSRCVHGTVPRQSVVAAPKAGFFLAGLQATRKN